MRLLLRRVIHRDRRLSSLSADYLSPRLIVDKIQPSAFSSISSAFCHARLIGFGIGGMRNLQKQASKIQRGARRWAAHDERRVQDCLVCHRVYTRTHARTRAITTRIHSKTLRPESLTAGSAVDSLVRNGWEFESESAARYTRTTTTFHRFFSAFFPPTTLLSLSLFVSLLFFFISFPADKQETRKAEPHNSRIKMRNTCKRMVKRIFLFRPILTRPTRATFTTLLPLVEN